MQTIIEIKGIAIISSSSIKVIKLNIYFLLGG